MELRNHPKMIWRGIPVWPPLWGGSYKEGDTFMGGEPTDTVLEEVYLVNDANPVALRLFTSHKKVYEHWAIIPCDDPAFLRNLYQELKNRLNDGQNLSMYQIGGLPTNFESKV